MKTFTISRLSLLALTLLLVLSVAPGDASGQEAEEHFIYFPIIFRPTPHVDDIHEPLLIDGEEGRIYATAKVDGVPQTVVLATADGHFLDTYPYSGRLALDRDNHRLLIDQGDEGVLVLDSISGHRQGVIEMPSSGQPPADPQADPNRGVAYAFRDHNVYVLDVEGLTVTGSHTPSVSLLVCGEPQGAAPITRSFYDLISDTLYISFNTWVCTGFISDTIHIYDASSWYKWGEYSTPNQYQAVPFAANLYGLSYMSRLTMHVYWARSRTETWYEENGGGNSISLAGNVIDWSRRLLYEAVWEYSPGSDVDKLIRISDTGNRDVLAIVSYDRPPIQGARLVGHDPHTDQLYFLEQGELYIVPTSSILPVDDQPLGHP